MDSLSTSKPIVGYNLFNLVKCLLSCIGIIFDTAFIIQHYVLYKYAVNCDHKKKLYGIKKE